MPNPDKPKPKAYHKDTKTRRRSIDFFMNFVTFVCTQRLRECRVCLRGKKLLSFG